MAGRIITRSGWSRVGDLPDLDLARGCVVYAVPQAGGGKAVPNLAGQQVRGFLKNTAVVRPSPFGTGMFSDGQDDAHLLIPANEKLRFSAQLTADIWFCATDYRSTSPFITGMVATYSDSASKGFTLRTGHGVSGDKAKPYFAVVFGGSEVGLLYDFSLSLNRLYHLAASYDGAKMRIFLDGEEVASVAQTGAFDTNTDITTVGDDFAQGSSNRVFTGWIYSAGIWNRAVAPEGVRRLNALGPGGLAKVGRMPYSIVPPYTDEMFACFTQPPIVPDLPSMMVPY